MSLGTTFYNIFLKRSSTFMVTIIGSAFFFERTFDIAADQIFRSINKGKLWDDIKHKYEK
ncbi:cytochrome b-c1 complex subunit 9 [Nasonia vitripennis]|nr:cytochrome b-c1 complex subunit 9 [Nasonia vitripennis]